MSTLPYDTAQGVRCPLCRQTYTAGEAHFCEPTTRCSECGQTYSTNLGHTCPQSPGQASTAAADELIGTTVGGRYEILSRIGQGGMGVVYKARHTILDSLVAVKVMLQPQDDAARRRFLQEAKLASQIRNPNVVYLSDFGILQDQRPFLVMEYIQGLTLTTLCQAGPVPLVRALGLAVQICRGLQGIHAQGVVHRDLKPENIFVIKDSGDRDLIKIVDFGIAKQLDSVLAGSRAASRAHGGKEGQAGLLSTPGAMIGTPLYMPPEQIEGRAADQRSDQYSLGCILYEMCSGELPFDGNSTVEILHDHLKAPLVPMRNRRPQLGLPPELDGIITRLMGKLPADRFASVHQAEQALSELLDRVTHPASPRRAGRPWLRPLLGALALCSAVAAGTWLFTSGHRHRGTLASDGVESSLRPGELPGLRARALELVQRNAATAAPDIRREAVSALGHTHDGALLPILTPFLKSEDASLPPPAALAIGQLGEPQGIPALLAALSGPGGAALEAAISVALEQLGDGRGQEHLKLMLGRGEPEAQFRAALELCRQGQQGASQLLASYLGSMSVPPELELRAQACLALRGDRALQQRLYERLGSTLHNRVKLATAAELMQTGDLESRRFVRALAEKPGPEQLLAARLLAGPDETSGLGLLRQVLADESAQPAARALAAEGLGAAGNLLDVRRLAPQLRAAAPELQQAAAGAILLLAASDPSLLSAQSLHFTRGAVSNRDWFVRQSAALILGDAPRAADALPRLIPMQADTDARVRTRVARALGRRQESEALLALRRLAGDTDAEVRKEALRGLARAGKALREQRGSPAAQNVMTWLREASASSLPEEEAQARAVLLGLGDTSQRQRLLTILEQSAPGARLAVTDNSEGNVELLSRGLSDREFEVRWSAARLLGELGEKRAVPVLFEALGHGGARAIQAFGLLRRLGEKATPPADLDASVSSADISARTQAIQAVASLPPELAVPLLRKATFDPEPSVRGDAAEAASEVHGPSAPLAASGILRLLLSDRHDAVRARAASLLARALSQPGSGLAPAEATPPPPVGPTFDLGVAASQDAAAPADGGLADKPLATGLLRLSGALGTQLQLDNGPLIPIPREPLELAAGEHQLKSADDTLTLTLAAGQVLSLSIPPSVVERLTHTGQDLLRQRKFAEAQKQLTRAGQLCSRERRYATLCAGLNQQIALAIGNAYEGQDRPAEAMAEYEHVLSLPEVHGVASSKATAGASAKRLEKELGQVIVPKRDQGGCRDAKIWMAPGTYDVTVDGANRSVKVRAREVVRAGACP